MNLNSISTQVITCVDTMKIRDKTGFRERLASHWSLSVTKLFLQVKHVYYRYSKPRISRIQVDRQIYPTYAKIRLTHSEMKEFGIIVSEISSETCEDPTYTSPTHARFTRAAYGLHFCARFSLGANNVHRISAAVCYVCLS